jgi:hypothetical protein
VKYVSYDFKAIAARTQQTFHAKSVFLQDFAPLAEPLDEEKRRSW